MIHTVYRFALATALCAALGCNDDDGADTGVASPAEITSTCQDYCDKAHVCDDEVAVDSCVSDCKDKLGDCMVDEQREAVDDLSLCAARACDNFTGCTIGARLQCTFGL